MDRTFGYFALFALVIGAFLGVAFGAAIEYTPHGDDFRAFAGLFVGWVVAAAIQNRNKIGHDK